MKAPASWDWPCACGLSNSSTHLAKFGQMNHELSCIIGVVRMFMNMSITSIRTTEVSGAPKVSPLYYAILFRPISSVARLVSHVLPSATLVRHIHAMPPGPVTQFTHCAHEVLFFPFINPQAPAESRDPSFLYQKVSSMFWASI